MIRISKQQLVEHGVPPGYAILRWDEMSEHCYVTKQEWIADWYGHFDN